MSQAEASGQSHQRSQSRDDLIEIDLGAIMMALRKRKGFIFFWTAFVTALAVGYCYVAPPVYRATATLLIESEQNNIVQIQELYGLDSRDQDYFQTQYEMLKSKDLATKVVEKLGLVDNDEFNAHKSIVDDVLLPLIQQLMGSVIKPAEAEEHLVRDIQWRLFLLGRFDYAATGELTEATKQAIDGFMVSRQRASRAEDLEAVLVELDAAITENDAANEERNASTTRERSLSRDLAETAALSTEGTAIVVPTQPIVPEPVAPVQEESKSFEQRLLEKLEVASLDEEHVATLERLIAGLDIQPVRKTKLINISFESQSAKMAAFIPNAVGQIYIDDYLQVKDAATDKASEWLVERLEKLEEALRESEQRLRDYKRENKLVDLDGGVTRYNEQELLSLSAKLLDAKRELAESKALYDEVQRLQVEAPERLENLLAVQSSQIVRTYKVERSEVEREIDELANRYGERHPKMLDAQARLEVINRNIALEIERVVATIVNDYELNRANVRSLSSAVNSGKREIEQIGEKGFELGQLQREVDANRKLYETFFNRYRETDEARSLESTNARISSLAQIPLEPVKPNKSLIVAASFVGCLLLTCMIAMMRESFDSTIDTMGGIEKIERRLGVPLVGIVPKQKGHLLQANKNEPICPPETAAEGGAFTEAIRTICSSITLSKKGKANKIIVVTSSVPDEGKSTASVNIAYELSKSEKTLLIDGDLRKPSIHKVFSLSSESLGMTHVLEEPTTAQALVQVNVMGDLDVLTAGQKTDSPTTLLTDTQLEEVLGVYKKQYDRIVIDTPPLHAVSDVLYLSKFADSVAYIVRSESTNMKLVERGVEKLRQLEAPIHGIVISQVDVQKMRSYGASYYSGYYDYYGYSS